MDQLASQVWGLIFGEEAPPPPPSGPLKRSGRLTVAELAAFIDACERTIRDPGTLDELRRVHQSGRDAGDAFTAKQERLFESLGIDGRFGVSQLACAEETTRGSQDGPDVMSRLLKLAESEDRLLDAAEGKEPARGGQQAPGAIDVVLPPEMQARLQAMPQAEQQRFLSELVRQTQTFLEAFNASSGYPRDQGLRESDRGRFAAFCQQQAADANNQQRR